MQAANMALAGNTRLRKQPKGYSGIDGARALLNDMIYESMSKYDAEIHKCTEFYAKQCALMETARGMIAASNFIAATSRALRPPAPTSPISLPPDRSGRRTS